MLAWTFSVLNQLRDISSHQCILSTLESEPSLISLSQTKEIICADLTLEHDVIE